MLDAGGRERLETADAPEAALQRARGGVVVAVAATGGETRLARLRQSGSAKCLLPKRRSGPVEAVLLNTAGGATGGDRFEHTLEAGPGAWLEATTQAAERAYRSAGGEALITTTIRAEAGARVDWLPQETILFDGSRLTRRLDATLAPDAVFLGLEATTLGRRAMGETVREGQYRERWRVRRGDRLIFADETWLRAPIDAALDARAAGGGATALATLLSVGRDSATALTAIAPVLQGLRCDGGADAASSALADDVLCARIVASHGAPLRAALTALAERLRDAPPPRVWRL